MCVRTHTLVSVLVGCLLGPACVWTCLSPCVLEARTKQETDENGWGRGKSKEQKKTDQRAGIRVDSDNVSAGILHDAFGLHL